MTQQTENLSGGCPSREGKAPLPGPGGAGAPRTLLLSTIFPPLNGGSGRWFWELYHRLPREHFVIAAGEHPDQEEFDRTHDLRLWRLPLDQPSWGLRSLAGLRGYWRTFRAVSRLVRAERIGHLHCGRCLPEGWVGWMLRQWMGLPYLCYVHGEEMNYAASSRELRWMMRRVLGAAGCIIANSRNTKRILREEWGVIGERIHVLHPGVDTKRFAPAAPDAEVRRSLGWTNRVVVLTVGRLQKRKGHDTMIRSLAAITQAVPNILYAIVGDGEERGLLEQLADEEGVRGNVRFYGELSDDHLVRCYQQCDLFLLPNRQVGADIEGFGMVLVEAQACGKPVLAGSSGGTAETMDIPHTGEVVPCENADGLAATVVRLLQDRVGLVGRGEAARRWAVHRFDWSSLGRQAESIFTRMKVGERGTPNGTHAAVKREE